MHSIRFLFSVFVFVVFAALARPPFALAQAVSETTISGRVVGQSDDPIAGVTVFLHNTTRGGVTDDEGRFTIEAPAGGYGRLVFAHVSFETLDRKLYIPAQGVDVGEVRLRARVLPLGEIVIEALGERTRRRYVRQFIDDVVGTSVIARKARLENPEALRFTEGKHGAVRAEATRPLVIFNPLTGYRIRIYLGGYVRSRSGYYLHRWISFESAPSGHQRRRHREKYRALAYAGSLQHFIDAWRRGTLRQEGFHVRQGSGRRSLPALRWDEAGWYVAQLGGSLLVDYFNRPDPHFEDYLDRTYPTGPIYEYPRNLQRSRISFPEGRLRLSRHGLLLGKVEREGYWAFLSLGDAVPPLGHSEERREGVGRRRPSSTRASPSTEKEHGFLSNSSER